MVKERLKRKALRRRRKTNIEGADVTCWGRLFQVWAAATGKAQSLTVDSRVRQGAGKSSPYVTGHLGQLSLPSLRGREIEYRPASGSS